MMSMSGKKTIGSIGWIDLTVDDAESVRDFYRDVVGWSSAPVDMGDYSDFNMSPQEGEPVAGVCHARGSNAELPPQWMIYIHVADLDQSLEACRKGGGAVIAGPKSAGPTGRYAVIRDPAGAVAALWQEIAANES